MRYLAIDLEVGKRNERINALAAVDSNGRSLVRTRLEQRELAGALHELDDFAEPADVILGHNLIHFDANRPALADEDFSELLREATALLRGEGIPPEEADEQRERLLAGFRWILVGA